MANKEDEHFYIVVDTKKDESSTGFLLGIDEQWIVKDVILEAGYDPQTLACIKFGDEVLIATHGSLSAPLNRVIIGDGKKKVYIFLDNDYNKEIILGGSYVIRKVIKY